MTFLNTRFLAAAAATAVFASPAFAFAATYAYVNTAGDVTTVTAPDATTALSTAPNMAVHSGVMLLVNETDAVVGDDVSGI